MPVSQWLVEAIEPQPGQRVLELAAGVGETGFLAAELIAPGGGTLISSDGAEAMLEHARARARAARRDATSSSSRSSWSGSTCRRRASTRSSAAGATCSRSTRPPPCARRAACCAPAAALALAAWSTPERNPFAAIPRRALVDAGLVDGFELAAGPTMFDLADAAALRELLEDAGFAEVVVEELPLTIRYDDVEDFVAATSDLSPAFARRRRAAERASARGSARAARRPRPRRSRRPTARSRCPAVALVAAGRGLSAPARARSGGSCGVGLPRSMRRRSVASTSAKLRALRAVRAAAAARRAAAPRSAATASGNARACARRPRQPVQLAHARRQRAEHHEVVQPLRRLVDPRHRDLERDERARAARLVGQVHLVARELRVPPGARTPRTSAARPRAASRTARRSARSRARRRRAPSRSAAARTARRSTAPTRTMTATVHSISSGSNASYGVPGGERAGVLGQLAVHALVQLVHLREHAVGLRARAEEDRLEVVRGARRAAGTARSRPPVDWLVPV